MQDNLVTKSTFAEQIVGCYERDKSLFPGESNPVVVNLRERALKIFAEKGFPGRKEEYYKYSPVQPLVKGYSLDASPVSFHKDQHIIDQEAVNIFIVDGKFDGVYGTPVPDGITISPLAASMQLPVMTRLGSAAKPETDQMIALNSLMFRDGVVVQIEKSLDRPVHIHYVNSSSTSAMVFPRVLISVAKSTEATVVEHYSSSSSTSSFAIPLTEIFIAENARMDHYRIQEENLTSNTVTSTNVMQKRDSFFSTQTFILGGSYTRNNLNIILDDRNIQTVLNGLYIAHDNQHVDNHTFVDHRMPDCLSNELYKGIAGGKSTGVFNGKIMVRQDAQKTNAYQSNKNILLSPDATINTKPQLEIYADDVKCSHGSTTGKINPEALFYLQARGIGKNAAMRLMLHAFASELVDEIKPEAIRSYVATRVEALLEK